jgi:hypothetical protein
MKKYSKTKLYITLAIIIPLLCLIFYDIYVKNETKVKGIEIVVKFDSIQKLPKTSYYYFSYYLNGKKISTCNSGLKKLFEFNKINVVPNKFYKAKRNPKNPEIIIVNQELEVLDTIILYKAGFSRKDINYNSIQ